MITSTIAGTLQEDGTLVLDEKPDLPPGRVRVTVQPVIDYKQTDMWKFFQEVQARLEASGFVFRTKEEIDADIAEGRDGDEERAHELERMGPTFS
jgi:hypothetical protein